MIQIGRTYGHVRTCFPLYAEDMFFKFLGIFKLSVAGKDRHIVSIAILGEMV
jgi:hypothetical protein